MATPAQGPEFSSTAKPIAWTALFFALVACALSTFVFFYTYEDGRLMQNVRVLGEETRKVIDSRRASRERKDGASLRWDKVGDRVDRIKTMVEDGDERAGYYIDVLKKDLSLLRDYSTEKGSKMLDSVMTGLGEARERVEEDTGAAVERLREIKKEIKPRIDSVVENIRERVDGED